ncbi:MAG: flagellar biosynthetic protein FliO [Acidimicrobiales bacterium]
MSAALLPLLATTTASSSHVSLLALLGRLVVSLLVVLGILWAIAVVVRRRGLGGGLRPSGRTPTRPASRPGLRPRPRQKVVDVVARQPLGKGQALLTVEVAGRLFLLGVTAQSITTLCELDPERVYGDDAASGDTAPGSERTTFLDWSPRGEWGKGELSMRLDQLRDLTVRR